MDRRRDRTTSDTQFSSNMLSSNIDCMTANPLYSLNEHSHEMSEPVAFLDDFGLKDTDAFSGVYSGSKSNDFTNEEQGSEKQLENLQPVSVTGSNENSTADVTPK